MSDYQSELDRLKKGKFWKKAKKIALPILLLVIVLVSAISIYFWSAKSPYITNERSKMKTGDDKIHNSSISNTQIESLINQAESAIKKEDFETAKILFRQATKLSGGLSKNQKAQSISKNCIEFGDQAFEALKSTGDINMLDIPKHWYELAQVIDNTPEIQSKIKACK